MKNALTAEVRPDKTGKLVTRHVRADDGASSAKGRSIPMPNVTPKISAEKQREILISDVAEIVSAPPANPTRWTKTPSLNSAIKTLDEFKDDAVIQSVGDALASPDTSQFLKSMIASSFYYEESGLEGYVKAAISVDKIYTDLDYYGEDMPSQFASDFSSLYTSMGFKESDFKGEITEEHIGYIKATLIANKLGIRPSRSQIKNVYYKQIDLIRENLDRVVPAIPVLMPVVSRDYGKETYADIAEVIDTIDRSGYDAKDIGDTMRERRTNDFGLVDEILGNGVPTVSSGVL